MAERLPRTTLNAIVDGVTANGSRIQLITDGPTVHALDADALVALVEDDLADRPPAQRHIEARALLDERRAELVQLADLMRERDGTVVDPERLLAEDRLAVALRAIIDT